MPNPTLTDSLIARNVLRTRSPYEAVVFGDSRAENFATNVNASRRQRMKSAQHPIVWLSALLGQRFRVVYNAGLSGGRIDTYGAGAARDQTLFPGLTNTDAVLATNALWVFWTGMCVNDLGQGFTADQVWNGYNDKPGIKATLDKFIAAGMRPVCFAEPGAENMTAAIVGEVHRFNRYLRTYCAKNLSAIYFDLPSVVWDQSNASTTAIKMKVGFYGDGVHMIVRGAYAAAAALAPIMSALIPPQPRLVSAPHEVPANGSVQLVTLPFASPAANAAPTVTGFTFNTTVPAGYSFTRALNGISTAGSNGAATCTVDVLDDAAGYGKAIRLAANFTQIGESVGIVIPADLTKIVPGDRLIMNMHIEIAAGTVGAGIRYTRLSLTADGATEVAYDLFDDAGQANFGPFPTVALSLDSETAPYLIPSFSTLTGNLIFSIGSNAAGASSITATVSRIGLWRELA